MHLLSWSRPYRRVFNIASASVRISKTSYQSLHDRLSHINDRDRDIMVRKQMLDGLESMTPTGNKGKTKCPDGGCQMGKAHVRSILEEAPTKPRAPGTHLSCDIGYLPVKTILGYMYFVLWIDLFTRCGFIYFMKKKDEWLSVFRRFMVDTRSKEKELKAIHYSLEMLTTDSDSLFMQKKMNDMREQMNFCQWFSCPHTHEQNPSENYSRIIGETAVALLHSSGFPLQL